eukprot:SAG22_NODE_9925_length_563_cov_1.017241_1_plen_138_part_00
MQGTAGSRPWTNRRTETPLFSGSLVHCGTGGHGVSAHAAAVLLGKERWMGVKSAVEAELGLMLPFRLKRDASKPIVCNGLREIKVYNLPVRLHWHTAAPRGTCQSLPPLGSQFFRMHFILYDEFFRMRFCCNLQFTR